MEKLCNGRRQREELLMIGGRRRERETTCGCAWEEEKMEKKCYMKEKENAG